MYSLSCRWWNEQLKKKKAGELVPDDKPPIPAKRSPYKRSRLDDKPSATKTRSLSNRGFRSVTVSSEPVTSTTSRVAETSGTNNDDKVGSQDTPESEPALSISTEESSSSDDDDVQTQPTTSQSKYSTPITQLTTSNNKNDSDKEAKRSRTKQKLPHTATSSNKRYILFLGNLSETSTHEDILAHFKKRGVAIKELRLLTRKDSKKSRGCAFAEFETEKSFQNALKFHRSKLNGKTINIEVTCGGGGASVKRKTKILNKNRRQRIKKARKSKV